MHMKSSLKSLNKLAESWENVAEIIPYGAGLEAYRTLGKIVEDFYIPYIVDKDEKKKGLQIYGVPVVGIEQLRKKKKSQKILITIAKRRYSEICKELKRYGFKEYEDFCHISQFGMEWYYKYKRKYCIFTMDMTITTACTLRCQKCNMFIPYYKKPIMYSVKEIQRNLDLLFERIDFVFAIGIIGGEALLHPDLEKILEYMYEKYRDRFGSLCITTNGVLIPDEKKLEIIKKYNIIVIISDYKHAITDKSKLDYLDDILNKRGIICQIRRDLIWCDFGFPEQPFSISNQNVREHMLGCDPGWRGLNDGKFYFCNVAWSAEKAGLFHLNREDYVVLEELLPNQEESKIELLRYSLGEMKQAAISFCRVCGGCGEDNQRFVEAGKQKKE